LYTRATLEDRWVPVRNSEGAVTAVTALANGVIVGVGTDRQLYTRFTLTAPWAAQANSGDVIGVFELITGSWIGVGTDGSLYASTRLGQRWTQVPDSGDVIAVTGTSDGGILGVGRDQQLATRLTPASPWVPVPNSGDVVSVTVLKDGTLLGVGKDDALYTRGYLTDTWLPVSDSGGVIGVATALDGSILGVGTDQNLRTRATLDSPWVPVPNTGNVVSVATPPTGGVVGVGTDHRLYQLQTFHDPWKPVPNSDNMSGVTWWTPNWYGNPLSEREVREAIAQYAPVLHFHPDEKYNMCSIGWFLAHATLHDKVTGKTIVHPTFEQLPGGSADDHRYWLTLEESATGGDLSTAKAYVHALWRNDLPFTDLQFFFFYAYNGPGTAHVNILAFDTIVHGGNATLNPLGAHFGDWESCVLRIDNASKRLIGVYISQHAGGRYIPESELGQLTRVNGEQIVLYASRNGHAVYPDVGPHYTYHYKEPPNLGDLPPPAAFEFFLRNDTADGGGSLDCAQHYEIIAAEAPIGVRSPLWVSYPYRWGPEGAVTRMSPKTANDLVVAALGIPTDLLPGSQLIDLVGEILPAFIKDDLNGPSAPISKDIWYGRY
jgi:hypothetical protein